VRREPEVGDLRRADVVLHQVRGLQVAVDDALRLGVHEARGRVAQDVERSRATTASRAGDALLERAAVHVLHREVVRAALLADVVDGDDVRVRERGGGARFRLEAPHELGVRRELRREHLERDRPVEARLHGEVPRAHAAAAERTLDPVAREDGGGERRLLSGPSVGAISSSPAPTIGTNAPVSSVRGCRGARRARARAARARRRRCDPRPSRAPARRGGRSRPCPTPSRGP
jgi:hypothetical protein